MLKILLQALALAVFCLYMGLAYPAWAIDQMLTLSDLPAGFAIASAAEAHACQTGGNTAAFVFKQETQLSQLICLSSFTLTVSEQAASQAELMRQALDQLLQHPEMIMQQANAADIADIEILHNLAGIGEVATGFKKAEVGIGTTEVALFRRGNVINSVLVRYPTDRQPIASLQAIARAVDRHSLAIASP